MGCGGGSSANEDPPRTRLFLFSCFPQDILRAIPFRPQLPLDAIPRRPQAARSSKFFAEPSYRAFMQKTLARMFCKNALQSILEHVNSVVPLASCGAAVQRQSRRIARNICATQGFLFDTLYARQQLSSVLS